MKFRNLFTLNLKTFIIDLIIFIVGCYLYTVSYVACDAVGTICTQSSINYLGLILLIISIVHFLINLIIFIINKFKKNKKK